MLRGVDSTYGNNARMQTTSPSNNTTYRAFLPLNVLVAER